MFDVIARDRPSGNRRLLTVLVSVGLHIVIVGAVIVVPLLYFTDQLPTPHEVVSVFAASAPPAAPPPPPPPPPPEAAAPEAPKAEATTGQTPVPIEVPTGIPPVSAPSGNAGSTGGVPGGVAGGIAGGVPGGTIGGLPDSSGNGQGAVRVGGQIKAPDLVHRVEPQYPPAAQQARVQGVVVLEATVDTGGYVQSAHVLRGSPLLNDAAINAVKQWRYSPLILNGTPTPFILTVTVNFRMQ
jgi:periplasmic protein TonB